MISKKQASPKTQIGQATQSVTSNTIITPQDMIWYSDATTAPNSFFNALGGGANYAVSNYPPATEEAQQVVNFSVRKAANGWILTADRMVYIAADVNELRDQIVVALVDKKLVEK